MVCLVHYHPPHFTQGELVFSKQFLRQKGPDSSHRCQYTGDDEQKPVQDALAATDLRSKDLEVECKGEDDTDRETQERPQESHDAVKSWEDDSQNDYHKHDKNAY